MRWRLVPSCCSRSRFGKEEVAVHGLRAELAEAMMSGIPVLTPVRIDLLPYWIAFPGPPDEVRAPTAGAIPEWARSQGIGVAARPAIAIDW
jgi:hypothetical protein